MRHFVSLGLPCKAAQRGPSTRVVSTDRFLPGIPSANITHGDLFSLRGRSGLAHSTCFRYPAASASGRGGGGGGDTWPRPREILTRPPVSSAPLRGSAWLSGEHVTRAGPIESTQAWLAWSSWRACSILPAEPGLTPAAAAELVVWGRPGARTQDGDSCFGKSRIWRLVMTFYWLL